MPENDPPQPDKAHPSPLAGEKVHERPEVKPLVEKAQAERDARIPHGTMRTGSDIPGGGGSQSLADPAASTPRTPASENSGE